MTGATGRHGGAVARNLLAGDKPCQLTARDDIAKFAGLAFDRPDDFLGRTLEIAGEELTNVQVAQVFSGVLGRKVRFPLLAPRLLGGYWAGRLSVGS